MAQQQREFLQASGLKTFYVKAGSGYPVLLLHGASIERAFVLFKLMPNAELHIFHDCAHWVQWDQSARFNQIAADFLRQVDGAEEA